MDVLVIFAFVAGIITVLSPCVLPVLPIVLSGSVGVGRLRPLGIITGFMASFSVLTLALTFFVRSFGIDPDILRLVAAFMIIAMAVILVVPALKDRFMTLISSVLSRKQKVQPNGVRPGFFPGVLTGLSLGVVWTPCVGPIMASVITVAISRSVDAGAVAITLAYALGTAVPLFAIMQGGRALVNRFPGFTGRLGSLQRIFGVLMLITGIAILNGWDRGFQSWMLDTFPGYGSSLTSIEDTAAVRSALEKRAEKTVSVPDMTGTDPFERTSGVWFNSPPLTLAGLSGKVVLVDFWTYSCINCLRTMPYLRSLQEKYASSGLVIVGVHSPEFAFERDAENVRKAISSIGVTWPVVQDNDFGIWNAFSNRYWPAHYIFDRTGKLVSTHFGEGGYAETEALVRKLLDLDSSESEVSTRDSALLSPGINEETYLGSARGKTLASDGSLYRSTGRPELFGWNLEGYWERTAEYIESKSDASLSLDFAAREVYLVVGTVDGAKAELTVLVDGKPVSSGEVTDGLLVPTGNRLYTLVSGTAIRKGLLTLRVKGRIRLYAFTFS